MLIDWFTVIAQVINFLVLVYLLKRFLYKPILNAVDAREKLIATRLEEAATQKAEAKGQHQKFQHLNDELNENRENLMVGARKEAEAEHLRLMEHARKEYDELRARLHESLQREQSTFGLDLRQRAQREIFDIARKVLADLAEANLETQIIRVFIQKLQGLSKEEMVQLRAAFLPTHDLTLRSAFDLTPGQQADIEKSVENLLEVTTKLQFSTVSEVVGGIELEGNGFKVAWNVTEHLDALEKRIAGLTDDIQGNQHEPETITP